MEEAADRDPLPEEPTLAEAARAREDGRLAGEVRDAGAVTDVAPPLEG